MMGSLFILMAKSGTGYPELYGGSRIVEGGCADIHYNSGTNRQISVYMKSHIEENMESQSKNNLLSQS